MRPTVSSGMRWSWDRRAALSGDWQAAFNEWVTQSAILSGAVWSASRSFASFSPRAMCGNANAGPLLWLELGSEAIRPGERKDVTAQWQCGPLFRYQRGAAIEQADGNQPAAEKCAQGSKPAARGALKVSEIAAATQSPTTTPARGIATSWSLGSVTSIAIASMLPATAAAMSIASPTRWKKAIRAELDPFRVGTNTRRDRNAPTAGAVHRAGHFGGVQVIELSMEY